MTKTDRIAVMLLMVIVGWGTGGYLFSTIEKKAEAPTVAFRAYTNQWQNHNNAKLVMCYQKMATQEEVNTCLLALNVFI